MNEKEGKKKELEMCSVHICYCCRHRVYRSCPFKEAYEKTCNIVIDDVGDALFCGAGGQIVPMGFDFVLTVAQCKEFEPLDDWEGVITDAWDDTIEEEYQKALNNYKEGFYDD